MSSPDSTYLKARAIEADRISKDPAFIDAMAAARDEFIREWLAAETTHEREAAHAKVHALDEVKRQLRRTVNRGVVAGAEV